MHKPEIVIPWSDSITEARGWLVIDNLLNGVCGGGTFMHPAATEKEVTELARTMSYKNTLQRIPFGGAKAGICYDPTRNDALHVLYRFLFFLRPWLETVWCTGSDFNTCNTTINAIVNAMGLSSMFGPLGKIVAYRSGIDDQSGDIFLRMNYPMTPYFSLAEGATGYSVALTIQQLCNKNPRIFIQGFGAVGRSLGYFLHQLNIATITGIADAAGAIVHPDGIEIPELLDNFYNAKENRNKTMGHWLDGALKKKYHYRARFEENDEDYIVNTLADRPIDVFSPCAGRYVITEKVAEALAHHPGIQVIAGANNVCDSETTLKTCLQKGILTLPEWISNCGNAVLYQELLSTTVMPDNSPLYFQDAIKKAIHFFIMEAEQQTATGDQQYERFIRTAEKRMTRKRSWTTELENVPV